MYIKVGFKGGQNYIGMFSWCDAERSPWWYTAFTIGTKNVLVKTITIYHLCEGQIENTSRRSLSGITKITGWCQTVIARDGFFYLPLTPMIDPYSCTHFISERFLNNAITLIADVRLTLTFNDDITFSDVKLNDGVRDVHYNKCISNTWEFSIFILPWVG